MIISTVTIVSLGVTVVYLLIALIGGISMGKRLRPSEKWVLTWLVFDVLIHFTLEGSFVYWSLVGTVNKADHFTASLWKEYALADKRWGVSDPTVVSLEILTVFIDGPLCLLLIYAIMKNKFYRHYVQIVLCVCELYGGWMTFCPEWLTGSMNLVTSNFLYLWVYLVFFNGLWVVIPLALMWQSYKDMQFMAEGGREVKATKIIETTQTTSVQHNYNTRSRKKKE
ncbi:hypothetical protein FSP39_002886 [Pinctada imbricata]|uniref:EXPERA domain-containing protein n=1 Tax=Pinctada imbricata TaxID=66713 RepID=A0AA89BQ81_PINIB|nr:hypothetical protein FSP39_002886 [Pinctada imbricata]